MLEKKIENLVVVEDKDILFKFSRLILNCESAWVYHDYNVPTDLRKCWGRDIGSYISHPKSWGTVPAVSLGFRPGLKPRISFPSVLWHCWLGLLTHKTRPRYVWWDVKPCSISISMYFTDKQQRVSVCRRDCCRQDGYVQVTVRCSSVAAW